MTQALFWLGIVVIALGMGLGYWDLRDRLSHIESDLNYLYHELGRHKVPPGAGVFSLRRAPQVKQLAHICHFSCDFNAASSLSARVREPSAESALRSVHSRTSSASRAS